MKKIYLSDSGPLTSDSIYSFWRWQESRDLTIEKMEEITHYTLDLGINSFDISKSYGLGEIEKLFGKVLNSKSVKREDVVIFSKVGYRSINSETKKLEYNELNEKYITQSVEASLKALNTDYIDVFLLDELDPLMNIEEVVSVLKKLELKGKIKHIGLSGFNVFQHRLFAQASLEVVTNHFEFNLLNTAAIDDGRIDVVKENYSKPMAWAPLAGGRILQGDDLKAIHIRIVLEGVAEKYASNIEQVAVAWIHKLGALPIIGSLNKDRIKNASTASGIQLSHEDWHLIYNAAK